MRDVPLLTPQLLNVYEDSGGPNILETGDGWVFGGETQLVHLDFKLKERSRMPLDGVSYPRLRGIGWGGTIGRVGLSYESGVALCDLEGHVVWKREFSKREFGDSSECAVLPGEGLLVVLEGTQEGDELHLLSLEDGQTISATQLDVFQAGCSFHLHPRQPCVCVNAGEGQDGSTLFWVTVDDGRLRVRKSDDSTRIFGAFDIEGRRYLTLPHSADCDGAIQVHEYPSSRVIHRVESGKLFEEDEDQFDYSAAFVDDEQIVVPTMLGQLLLFNTRNLTLQAKIQLIDPDEPAIQNFEDAVTVTRGLPGEFLTEHHGLGLRTWQL